jgi:hypothetical protein
MPASQITTYGELASLNWMFTQTPTTGPNTRPTTWFGALSTTDPTAAGTSGVEPVGNGYSRQSIIFSPASGAPAQVANSNFVQFTASGAGWGTVAFLMVFDSLTLGNCWAVGPLTTARVVNGGDTLQFQPTQISIGHIL